MINPFSYISHLVWTLYYILNSRQQLDTLLISNLIGIPLIFLKFNFVYDFNFNHAYQTWLKNYLN